MARAVSRGAVWGKSERKRASRRTEAAWKAQLPGESAPDDEARQVQGIG